MYLFLLLLCIPHSTVIADQFHISPDGHTDQTNSSALDSFKQWLFDNGAYVHPSLSLEYNPEYEFHVKVNHPIQKGEPLLSISFPIVSLSIKK